MKDLGYGLVFTENDEFQVALAKEIAEWLSGSPGPVLDIGTNSGLLLEEYRRRGITAVGVDATVKCVEAAKARGLNVIHASGDDLPFSDKVFSTAVLSCVLEQCEDPMPLLREAERVAHHVVVICAREESPWANPGYGSVKSAPPLDYLRSRRGGVHKLTRVDSCTRSKSFDKIHVYKCFYAAKKIPVAVFTVNLGNYDTLSKPVFIDSEGSWSPYEVEYFCFTDHIAEEVPPYKYLPLVAKGVSVQQHYLSRAPKLVPEAVLPGEYTYSIYHDALLELVDDPVHIAHLIGSKYGEADEYPHALMYAHPGRDCVYREIDCCLKHNIGDPARLNAMRDRYKWQGIPEAGGLWAAGFIVRKHGTITSKFNQTWWREFYHCQSERDQLALVSALRQSPDFRLSTLAGDIYNNSHVRLAYRGHGLPSPMRDRAEAISQRLQSLFA